MDSTLEEVLQTQSRQLTEKRPRDVPVGASGHPGILLSFKKHCFSAPHWQFPVPSGKADLVPATGQREMPLHNSQSRHIEKLQLVT